jgi:thiopurine S-methyltransferase
MDTHDYWKARWQRGETGWHQNEVEPALVKWASERKPGRILVPLCGKSQDLAWLASKGFDVVGVELSELACETFFTENKIQYQKAHEGHFNLFTAQNITLFNGDFFKLSRKLLGPVQAVYDRAALIALPEKMRKTYSVHLQSLIESATDFLQIIIARTPHDETGPPYSVSPAEVEKLYKEKFTIKIESKEEVQARAPEGSRTHEYVLSLLIP